MNNFSAISAVLAVVLALLVFATLLPLWSHRSWLVRGLDFPRVQLMWLAITLFVLAAAVPSASATASIILCLGFLLCALAQARYLIRFTPWVRQEVTDSSGSAPDHSLSLLIANVLMTNKRTDSLLDAVERYQPDVVLALETDQRWDQALSELSGQYPHRVAQPQDNLYGMHLFSKLPLAETTTGFLVEDDVPSIHTLIELASGATLRAHFLHPAPPSPSENASSEERDSELILVAKSLEDDDLPVIVGGDLNDVGWSRNTELFKRISGLCDIRVGRGLFPTFDARYPLLRWPLDHLFVSRHFQMSQLERVPVAGSDHFALFANIVLQSSAEVSTAADELSAQDRKDVAEMLDSQDADVADVPKPDQQ